MTSRRLDSDQLEQCRHHVDRVHVLVTRLAIGSDAGGPMHDERIGDTALVRVALEALERRVAGPRPAPGVVVVGVRSTEVVDPAQVLVEALGHEVEEVLLVERALRATFGRCAVVTHHEDDGVVELAELGDEVQHPLHLRVGVRQEPGEDLHHARRESLLVGSQRIPRRHPRGPLGEQRVPAGAVPTRAGGRTPRRASGPSPGRTGRDSGR